MQFPLYIYNKYLLVLLLHNPVDFFSPVCKKVDVNSVFVFIHFTFYAF